MINPFIIAVILISAYFGYFDEYIIMFTALLLHETAHLVSVKRNLIEINSIRIEPFGMRITLKDEIINNPYDEIKIALAGPLFSIITGLISAIFFKGYYMDYFAKANIYLGIFNILPAYPTDGGRILRAYLSTKTGYLKSYNTTRKLTLYISLLILLAGGYILWVTKFNFSVCIIGMFLCFGVLTEKNHTTYYLNKELSNFKNKNTPFDKMPVMRIAVKLSYPIRKVLSELSLSRYLILEIIEGNKKLGELTEGEVMEEMLIKGSDITIKDIYKTKYL